MIKNNWPINSTIIEKIIIIFLTNSSAEKEFDDFVYSIKKVVYCIYLMKYLSLSNNTFVSISENNCR